MPGRSWPRTNPSTLAGMSNGFEGSCACQQSTESLSSCQPELQLSSHPQQSVNDSKCKGRISEDPTGIAKRDMLAHVLSDGTDSRKVAFECTRLLNVP